MSSRVMGILCVTMSLLAHLLSASGVSASAGEGARKELVEVPRPNLENLDEAARQQLEQARSQLDSALVEAVPPEELGDAYGALGQRYFLYDLPALAQACFRNASSLEPEDYRWNYYLGVLYQLDGEPAKAAAHLELVLALRPEEVPALLRLGSVEILRDRLVAAERHFARAVELEPKSAAGWDGLGRVAASRADHLAAIKHFERALELQPEANAIHHRLGMAFRQAGDLEQARVHLELNRGKMIRFPDPLIDTLGTLVQSAEIHFQAGVDAMSAQSYEEAIHHFRLALEKMPDDYLVTYNLAMAYMKLGSRAEAKRWLEVSVEIDPDFRNGHFNLATLLAEGGLYAEAEAHFRRAHEIDPEDQTAHLEWATALSRIGQPDRAIDELERLVALDPGNRRALLHLGTILLAQAGRREEAVAALERVAESTAEPATRAEAHLGLGALAEQEGRRAEALEHFGTAVELDPSSEEAQRNLASALGRAGRFAEAAEAYSAVIELAPDRVDAHFGRAMALLLAEDYASARQGLESSLAQHPDKLPLRHLLARLLATCPDPEIRDGERSLALATQVLQQARTFDHTETVAMALAELGRFDEAAEVERRLVAEAEQAGQSGLAETARTRLRLYERGEPSRAPWKDG